MRLSRLRALQFAVSPKMYSHEPKDAVPLDLDQPVLKWLTKHRLVELFDPVHPPWSDGRFAYYRITLKGKDSLVKAAHEYAHPFRIKAVIPKASRRCAKTGRSNTIFISVNGFSCGKELRCCRPKDHSETDCWFRDELNS